MDTDLHGLKSMGSLIRVSSVLIRGRNLLRSIELWPRRIMLLRALQNFVVRRRLVFVIVRLPVIFSHREIFEFVPHQDAAQIGVTVEPDSVEIENFALLEFGAPPDW